MHWNFKTIFTSGQRWNYIKENCNSCNRVSTQARHHYWSIRLRFFNNKTCFFFFFPVSLILFLSVTIDSLYKVTEGGQSDIFHRHADGSFDPACCFTVYHGNHMESLDLVTSNAEEARTWITGLRYLMAGISDEDSLAKRQRTHDQYPSAQCLLCAHHLVWILSFFWKHAIHMK